jgi:hypothetical protein
MTDTATQGALDAMVAGVLARKAQAGTKLTPVGAERFRVTAVTPEEIKLAPLAGPIPADFPWDMPLQNISAALLSIRRQLTILEEGCCAIEKAAGLQEGGPTVAVSKEQARLDAVKAKEVESEARFRAQAPARDPEKLELDDEADFTEAFARKAADAQEQAFAPVAVGAETQTLWTCSVHGKAEEKVSPKGRHYLACPSCLEFER